MKISAESHTYFCPGVGCVLYLLYGLSGGLVVYPSAPKEGEMSRLPSAGGIIAHRGPGEHRRGEDAHLILTSVLQFATY